MLLGSRQLKHLGIRSKFLLLLPQLYNDGKRQVLKLGVRVRVRVSDTVREAFTVLPLFSPACDQLRIFSLQEGTRIDRATCPRVRTP